MRRFRLCFGIYLATLVALSVLTGWLLWAGMIPQAILSTVLLAGVVAGLCRLIWNVVATVSAFGEALEMNDATLRFPPSDDPALNRMSVSMNRIIEQYNKTRLDLETRKLYYDRILRIMSHELRNAITPIVSVSSDMETHPQRYSGDSFNDAVGIIRNQSEGIKRFLDAYYELTHLPRPETTATEMHGLFRGLQKSMSLTASSLGLPEEVITYYVANDMVASVDPDLFRQAMINLLRNALEAVKDRDNPKVEVMVTCSDNHPFITLSDNGCGIPPDMMENLFQPFFTTKPGGSGIGLYLSRQIIRMHGGDIELMSSSPWGTSFSISLP